MGLKKENKIKLNCVIWNNGPKKIQYSKDTVDFNEIEIIDNCENTSLSYIYNNIFRRYPADFYTILDDDSSFDDNFISQISGNDLIVPIARCGDEIISPALSNLKRLRSVSSGTHIARCYRAIGSGMTIPHWYFSTQEFDEDFNFYGVDSEYFWRYSNNQSYFKVIDCNFKHSLSSSINEPIAMIKFRYFELIKSIYTLGLKKRERLRTSFRILKISLKIFFKTRSIEVAKFGIMSSFTVLLDTKNRHLVRTHNED